MILDVRTRLVVASVHLGICAAIAAVVAVVTLALWYPGTLGIIAGGRDLYLLVVTVDVVLGPLLTFVVYDKKKSRKELVRDLTIIAAVQLGGLAYGLNTVFLARPIALVFELNRFRVVTSIDVRREELADASPEYRTLPLTGPRILGTRAARSSDERMQSLDLALKGYDVGQRPSLWQPYADSRASALAQSRPVDVLIQHFPGRAAELQRVLKELKAPQDARFLPLVARHDWVVILSSAGDVVGYAPFDGFF